MPRLKFMSIECCSSNLYWSPDSRKEIDGFPLVVQTTEIYTCRDRSLTVRTTTRSSSRVTRTDPAIHLDVLPDYQVRVTMQSKYTSAVDAMLINYPARLAWSSRRWIIESLLPGTWTGHQIGRRNVRLLRELDILESYVPLHWVSEILGACPILERLGAEIFMTRPSSDSPYHTRDWNSSVNIFLQRCATLKAATILGADLAWLPHFTQCKRLYFECLAPDPNLPQAVIEAPHQTLNRLEVLHVDLSLLKFETRSELNSTFEMIKRNATERTRITVITPFDVDPVVL